MLLCFWRVLISRAPHVAALFDANQRHSSAKPAKQWSIFHRMLLASHVLEHLHGWGYQFLDLCRLCFCRQVLCFIPAPPPIVGLEGLRRNHGEPYIFCCACFRRCESNYCSRRTIFQTEVDHNGYLRVRSAERRRCSWVSS